MVQSVNHKYGGVFRKKLQTSKMGHAMKHFRKSRILALTAMVLTGVGLAEKTAQASNVTTTLCGYYQMLGCFSTYQRAQNQLARLGGKGAGGYGIQWSEGAHVINGYDLPNFRNGLFCVADGPYHDRQTAHTIPWVNAVPDAYVKNGC